MRLGIRTKFLILISILLVSIFAGTTIYLIKNRTAALRQDIFEQSQAFATLATPPVGNVFAIYKDSGTHKVTQEVDRFTALNDSVVNIAIVDITGATLYSQNQDRAPNFSAAIASTFEPIYKYDQSGTLQTIIYPYFEASGARRYTLIYEISDKEISKAINTEVRSLLLFGVLSLIITMVLVYVLINRLIIQPVRQVSEQAGIISAGKLEQQILVHGHDEIANLGDSVNKMAESLKKSIAELQEVDKIKSEFMMITSHNLRTPLAIISGYLDNMNIVMKDPKKLMSSLQRIGISVKRLEAFAEDVLTISRFELGEAKPAFESVNVKDLISRIQKEFASTVEAHNLEFKVEIQNPESSINISIPYIRSAVWNLLDNAVKFTKEGHVTLRTFDEDQHVCIEISDTGVGITSDELPKIFTKFHRGTSTLVYDFEGTGIGLYASKMMVERHGGTISVQSQVGKGSTFLIKLPKAT